MAIVIQFFAALLASTVEMVEALTIILAVGVTRSWRPALFGMAAGFGLLAIVVAALGPALVDYVPIDTLRIIIGSLLLCFGLQWLRKAILRASGLKAMHDEARIYAEEVAELRAAGRGSAFDWTGFTVAFKGVFLEGLEVVFIVLTFGTNEGRFDVPIAGALVGFVLVAATGVLVHKPLSRVPENTIKFAVGIALSSFGTFWVGEGVGIEWTFADVMLPVLGALFAGAAFVLVAYLRPKAPAAAPIAEAAQS